MNLIHFERRVRQYQDRVFGFACAFLRDHEAAKDVTQEVLIRYWNHREAVDDERLLGWLLRVTRNACIDATRARTSFRQVHAVDTEALDRAPGDADAPDRRLADADFERRLEHALDALAEPYRSIVILREVQDLKYEEISGAMNLPLNTVKVYLHRGRKMLRQQLTEVLHRDLA